MKAYERLLNYVVVRTPSDENSETVPSSTCQFDLARLLEAEMKELGLTDVILDDQCYLESFQLPKAWKTSRRSDSSHTWIPYQTSVTMISNQLLLKIMTVVNSDSEQVILF